MVAKYYYAFIETAGILQLGKGEGILARWVVLDFDFPQIQQHKTCKLKKLKK